LLNQAGMTSYTGLSFIDKTVIMTVEGFKELILRITAFHPASDAGLKGGWSTYTGGMRDTGGWDYRKLLEAPADQLHGLLADLQKEWSAPPRMGPHPTDTYMWELFSREMERRFLTGEAPGPLRDGSSFTIDFREEDFAPDPANWAQKKPASLGLAGSREQACQADS
jgi:hypothetical protein